MPFKKIKSMLVYLLSIFWGVTSYELFLGAFDPRRRPGNSSSLNDRVGGCLRYTIWSGDLKSNDIDDVIKGIFKRLLSQMTALMYVRLRSRGKYFSSPWNFIASYNNKTSLNLPYLTHVALPTQTQLGTTFLSPL